MKNSIHMKNLIMSNLPVGEQRVDEDHRPVSSFHTIVIDLVMSNLPVGEQRVDEDHRPVRTDSIGHRLKVFVDGRANHRLRRE